MAAEGRALEIRFPFEKFYFYPEDVNFPATRTQISVFTTKLICFLLFRRSSAVEKMHACVCVFVSEAEAKDKLALKRNDARADLQ